MTDCILCEKYGECEHHSETYSGPVWMPATAADQSRWNEQHGGWEQTIERRRIVGRVGWQRVTESYWHEGEKR